MDSQKSRFLFSMFLGGVYLVGGTFGYKYLEGWSYLDSFYMTVITVATIGYGEIRPLSETGRIFTIFLIIFGVGNAAYLVGQITRVMVEGSLMRVMGRRKLETRIKKLNDHYILCGYGRIGRMVGREITRAGMPVVVIENHPDVVDQLERDQMLYLRGDASDEDNLIEAGIKRALGLIAAVSSDADNLFIVLTARGLNPGLYVLSRVSEERSVKKLLGAGADKVISPYNIGAQKMAQSVLRPAVADFLASADSIGEKALVMEEILVTHDSKIKDVSLMESNIRRDLDLIVIAIKKADGKMLFNPSAQALIEQGDILIAVGMKDNMDRLVKVLGADASVLPQYSRRRTQAQTWAVDEEEA